MFNIGRTVSGGALYWFVWPLAVALAAGGCLVPPPPDNGGGIDPVIGCVPGSANCDLNLANGCEVDVRSSVLHCGACGQACPDGRRCVAGKCLATQLNCPPGVEDCDGQARSGCETDVLTDPRHCGRCGNACQPGETCQNALCIVTTVNCSPGRFDCDGAQVNGCEVDLMLDAMNCGQCGVRCAPGHSCVHGHCQSMPLVCPAGRADCDGLPNNGCEVDLGSDVLHCGSCAFRCDPGAVCINRHCQLAPLPCPPGQADCDGLPNNGCEVILHADAQHCGSCDSACLVGERCLNGLCQLPGPTCPMGRADCDGQPANGCEVDLLADRGHCGSCTHACRHYEICLGGHCKAPTIQCPAGRADCDGSRRNGCEVVLATDAQNCGSCERECSNHESCISGACVALPIPCPAGFADCDGRRYNGCETNLNLDARHCGSCGTMCQPGLVCSNGLCTGAGPTCPQGTANCDGQPNNGCEVNTQIDNNNCGMCNAACLPGRACTNGICTRPGSVCPPGTADCDGRRRNGCEVNTQTDNNNCGACGIVCAPGHTCTNAVCVGPGPTCPVGTADCDGMPNNGCEVNTLTDAAHCGMCNAACWVGRVCTNGVCTRPPPMCPPGTADCDGSRRNGCEVNTQADPAHCGMCNAACSSDWVCTNGVCTRPPPMCPPGMADCDGSPGNGCEVNTQTDKNNCGACGNACRRRRTCVNGLCRH